MPEEQAVASESTTQNCAGCGKQVAKIKRYYRNGKYYCSKRCYKDKLKKASQEKAGE